MVGDARLSAWLVARRPEIETRLGARLAGGLPGPGSAEAEALRRFRSYATSALLRGPEALPALDGLRAPADRVVPLIESWVEAASDLAGPDGQWVRAALEPLAIGFAAALRGSTTERKARGTPRSSKRRAVSAAIDRLADAFLAIDTDSLRIADANPAAGALLGLPRDRLLEEDALAFVPEIARPAWTVHIDAMAETSEPRRFRGQLRDANGAALEVDARITRFATRRRTLALLLARPTN